MLRSSRVVGIDDNSSNSPLALGTAVCQVTLLTQSDELWEMELDGTIIKRIVGEMKKELAKLMRRAMAAEDRDQIVEDLTCAIVEDLTKPKTSYFKASAS
ncbi:hypothetical protein Nepgr_024104 [Nepenthes gracilis]|uniref:Uncharacterized protein n=1 Tax=Nepenthes gracilis TaxID=150966 RepID=A0AAD3Y055_NEPGR|nr:hypothetical protein Nepgr_024104 [Nepenthes gracilis]